MSTHDEWTLDAEKGGIIHRRVFEMAEEAYRGGQPFIDDLVDVLMRRGAQTPTARRFFMCKGLLRDSYTNPFLTSDEREAIWRRCEPSRLVRLAYRFETWRALRRLRRAPA